MSAYLGEIFALLSALCFATFNVVITASSSSRGDKGVLFSVIVTIGFSLAVFLALEARGLSLPATGETLAGLGYFAFAGVAAMAFGRSLVFESIRRLGATRAAAVKRLNPFFSVVLAAVLLSEAVSGVDLAGLAAIALGFAILIRESLQRARGTPASAGPAAYLVGASAAFAYAVAYVGRKAGLEVVDAPALGTFISALSGFAALALLALFSRRYRPMFTNVLRNVDRVVFAASVLVSVGQILMFAALAYAPVTTVVMISSLEIFFSIFLSTLVFRTESVPGPAVLMAAAFAVVGVILVAVG